MKQLTLDEMSMEERWEKLDEMIEKFEEQFDVELNSTGFEDADFKGIELSKEFWVNGLIETTDYSHFNIQTGGWFRYYPERKEGFASIAIFIDHEDIAPTYSFQASYSGDTKSWSKIDFQPM